jgi:putative oxidoreductase
MTPVRTVARALLAAVFVKGGLDAYKNPDRFADGAQAVTDRLGPTLDSVGLPTDPRALVRLTGVVQMAGGILLATNTFTRPAALALAGSLIPSTVSGQDFWSGAERPEAAPGPVLRGGDPTPVLKNLGLMGGLLLAAVDTEGRPGLAWRTGHLAGHAQESVKRVAQTTAKETKRAAHAGAKETKRAAHLTAKEAKRAAHLTAKEARRATEGARRTARTAARETKLAVASVTP